MYLQTTSPEERIFHEQTNTFDLTVLFNEGKLTFTLKDFADWAVYEKEYTENDIGGEIHKKMDLADISSAFI